MNEIEQIFSDTLIEKPIVFAVGSKRFYLYHVTIGKAYLLSPLIRQLDINVENLTKNQYAEIIRVVGNNVDVCCQILAIHTLRGKKALDGYCVKYRAELFKKSLAADDLVTLIQYVLANNHLPDILKHYGINEELKEYNKARQAQKSSSLAYGGKTIYGTLISSLAEKYGWTLDYILWGISYDNIQLLIADSFKTVYLSEEERQAAGIYDRSTVLDGNKVETWEKLKDSPWFQRAQKSGDITFNE